MVVRQHNPESPLVEVTIRLADIVRENADEHLWEFLLALGLRARPVDARRDFPDGRSVDAVALLGAVLDRPLSCTAGLAPDRLTFEIRVRQYPSAERRPGLPLGVRRQSQVAGGWLHWTGERWERARRAGP